MRRFHTVSCSVTGHRKRLEGLVCEDATRVLHTGGGTVIAVADGHGDRRCLHASVGAQLAVAAACDTLKRYLRSVKGDAARYWNGLRREIARDTVKAFAGAVLTDYRARYSERLSEAAFTELEAHVASYFASSEETFTPSQLRERYENKKRLDSALSGVLYLYGTTVRATVLTDAYLFNLALGDGDSLAVVDGRLEWLLPKSDAYECRTASMCEPLGASSEAFEFSFVSLSDGKRGARGIDDVRVNVSAVVLATDGLRNSFFSERIFADKLLDVISAGSKRSDSGKLRRLYERLSMQSVFQDDISTVIAFGPSETAC